MTKILQRDEKELMQKLLLQFSVPELHHFIVSPPEAGVLKLSRVEDNGIIISGSNLRNITPPQLRKMTSQYKVMCW